MLFPGCGLRIQRFQELGIWGMGCGFMIPWSSGHVTLWSPDPWRGSLIRCSRGFLVLLGSRVPLVFCSHGPVISNRSSYVFQSRDAALPHLLKSCSCLPPLRVFAKGRELHRPQPPRTRLPQVEACGHSVCLKGQIFQPSLALMGIHIFFTDGCPLLWALETPRFRIFSAAPEPGSF